VTAHGIATLAMQRMLDGEEEVPWDKPTTLAFARRAFATLSRGLAPDPVVRSSRSKPRD
jgi:hypothetical protein